MRIGKKNNLLGESYKENNNDNLPDWSNDVSKNTDYTKLLIHYNSVGYVGFRDLS